MSLFSQPDASDFNRQRHSIDDASEHLIDSSATACCSCALHRRARIKFPTEKNITSKIVKIIPVINSPIKTLLPDFPDVSKVI